MEEIIDIFLYYKFNDEEIFSLDDSFYGRAIKKGNKIEGAIKEFDRDNCSFIYGTLDEKGISVIQCSKDKISHKFDGEKEGHSFYGTYWATDGSIDIPLGESKINMLYAETTRETTDFELSRLRNAIEKYKSQMSDENMKQYTMWQQKEKKFIKK